MPVLAVTITDKSKASLYARAIEIPRIPLFLVQEAKLREIACPSWSSGTRGHYQHVKIGKAGITGNGCRLSPLLVLS